MKLSIIVPTYNVENYIGKTLLTLFSQSKLDFEIIIVDDGSTDNTRLVITELIEKNKLPNIKFINKENNGVSSARNRGLYEATGDYVIFLDGDDYVRSDLVNSVIEVINEGNYEVICWKFNQVTFDGEVIREYSDDHEYNQIFNGGEKVLNEIFKGGMRIWIGSTAYQRDFLINNNLKYDEKFYSGQDLEFIYKVLIEAKKVRFINKTLTYYVQRKGSKTHSYNILKFQSISALKQVYEYIENKNRDELKDLSDKMLYRIIPDNYFFNLKSCVKELRYQGYSVKKAVTKIQNDLQENLPEVREFIDDLFEAYPGSDSKIKVMIQLYRISPYVYLKFSDIGNAVLNRY